MIKLPSVLKIKSKINRRRGQDKKDQEQLQTVAASSSYDIRSILATSENDDDVSTPRSFRDIPDAVVSECDLNSGWAFLEESEKDEEDRTNETSTIETNSFTKEESSSDGEDSIDDIRKEFEASFCDLSSYFPCDYEEDEKSASSAEATFQDSFKGLDEKSLGSDVSADESSAFHETEPFDTVEADMAEEASIETSSLSEWMSEMGETPMRKLTFSDITPLEDMDQMVLKTISEGEESDSSDRLSSADKLTLEGQGSYDDVGLGPDGSPDLSMNTEGEIEEIDKLAKGSRRALNLIATVTGSVAICAYVFHQFQ